MSSITDCGDGSLVDNPGRLNLFNGVLSKTPLSPLCVESTNKSEGEIC